MRKMKPKMCSLELCKGYSPDLSMNDIHVQKGAEKAKQHKRFHKKYKPKIHLIYRNPSVI